MCLKCVKAQAAGYIAGYPEDNTIGPDNAITREEVAKVISFVEILQEQKLFLA